MFGFPTRVRRLNHKPSRAYFELDGVVDRHLDIAISQFAPGSETIKDKKIHISVGIIDEHNIDHIHSVYSCKQCRSVTINPDNLNKCKVCGKERTEDFEIFNAYEPKEFFTLANLEGYYKAPDYDGSFDYMPFASKPKLVSGEPIDFNTHPDFNFKTALSPEGKDEIISINTNANEFFRLEKLTKEGYWATREACDKYVEKARNVDSRIFENSEIKPVALASIKVTDILLAEINNIPSFVNINPEEIYARSALYSFGFLFRKASAVLLDIDEREINVGIRPFGYEDKGLIGQIFLSDSLENGAGYSKELSTPERFLEILKMISDENKMFNQSFISDQHQNNCDSSCYHCLRDYSNLHYHGLLDWRLGFDIANMMLNKDFIPSLKNDYWSSLTNRALESHLQVVNSINPHSGFQKDPEHLCICNGTEVHFLKHPIWSDRSEILSIPEFKNSYEYYTRKGYDSEDIKLINIFDVIKRPIVTIDQVHSNTQQKISV